MCVLDNPPSLIYIIKQASLKHILLHCSSITHLVLIKDSFVFQSWIWWWQVLLRLLTTSLPLSCLMKFLTVSPAAKLKATSASQEKTLFVKMVTEGDCVWLKKKSEWFREKRREKKHTKVAHPPTNAFNLKLRKWGLAKCLLLSHLSVLLRRFGIRTHTKMHTPQ